MHLCVDLLVFRLPEVGHDGDSLSKGDVAHLDYRQLESFLVATDSSKQYTPLLVEVVLR